MARLDKEVAEAYAQKANEVEKEDIAGDDIFDSDELDSQLLKATEGMDQGFGVSSSEPDEPGHAAGVERVSEAGLRASNTAVQHIAWLEARGEASMMGEPSYKC